jgi:hypothetical protein
MVTAMSAARIALGSFLKVAKIAKVSLLRASYLAIFIIRTPGTLAILQRSRLRGERQGAQGTQGTHERATSI